MCVCKLRNVKRKDNQILSILKFSARSMLLSYSNVLKNRCLFCYPVVWRVMKICIRYRRMLFTTSGPGPNAIPLLVSRLLQGTVKRLCPERVNSAKHTTEAWDIPGPGKLSSREVQRSDHQRSSILIYSAQKRRGGTIRLRLPWHSRETLNQLQGRAQLGPLWPAIFLFSVKT